MNDSRERLKSWIVPSSSRTHELLYHLTTRRPKVRSQLLCYTASPGNSLIGAFSQVEGDEACFAKVLTMKNRRK